MLFGGESRLRLEPVREMRRTARDRPVSDYLRDFRRDVDVQLLPEANGREELGVDLRRQLVAHLTRAKGVDTEILRDACTGHWTAVVGAAVRAGSTVGSSCTRRDLAVYFLTIVGG